MGQLRRLFLGVPLDEEVRAMLAQHLQKHRVPGRLVPPANWHLTIRFLGNVSEVVMQRLTAELDESDLGEAFEVVLGEMGAFPRPGRAAVVWLAISRGRDRLDELNEIAEEASQAVALAPEERPFAPHLTLSRIRPETDVRAELADYRLAPFRWTVGEMVLYESHLGRGGAVYEPVERFPLGS